MAQTTKFYLELHHFKRKEICELQTRFRMAAHKNFLQLFVVSRVKGVRLWNCEKLVNIKEPVSAKSFEANTLGLKLFISQNVSNCYDRERIIIFAMKLAILSWLKLFWFNFDAVNSIEFQLFIVVEKNNGVTIQMKRLCQNFYIVVFICRYFTIGIINYFSRLYTWASSWSEKVNQKEEAHCIFAQSRKSVWHPF